MAKFPIYEAQGSLPGVSGQVRQSYDTSTGAERVARSVQRLGATAFDIGTKEYRRQGEIEVAEAMAQADDKVQKMFIGFEGNQDENTYDQIWKDTYSEIQANEPKNGWARQQYRQSMLKLKGTIGKQVYSAKIARLADKQKWQLSLADAKARQTGNMGVLDTFLSGMVEDGDMSPEEKQYRLEDAQHAASVNRMTAIAENNPDFILGLTTWSDMQKQDPNLRVGDYSRIKGLATAQKALMEKRHGEQWNALREEVFGKARTMTPDEFRKELALRPNISEQDKTELLQTYLNATKMWQNEGVNPWEHTTDTGSLATTMMMVDRGLIKSLDEIDSRWLEDNKPNWSFDDWRKVTNLWKSMNKPQEGQNKFSRTHPMAATYFDMLASRFEQDTETVNGRLVFTDPQKANEYTAMYGALETAFKDPNVWGNPAKMGAAYEAIVGPYKQEKAKGWLKRLLPHRTETRFYKVPTSADEFKRIVKLIAETDKEEARRYYDKYKGNF